jgi:hypothetical protein
MTNGDTATVTAGRLDTVAQTLAGATVATAALLTTFGLNSDRVWLLLDQDRLSGHLILAGLMAVGAIACSIFAIFLPPDSIRLQAAVLGIGAVFYVASLVAVLWVAADAGDRAGAPLIQSATIHGSEDSRSLELHIVGQQLDPDQSASVSVELGSSTLYSSAIPSDFEGKIDQSVVIPLASATLGEALKVTAWRADKGIPDCDRVHDYGPSCLTLEVVP